ncbi:MAG TPA: tripartite tricarboxylate transporter TctB family protein [Spirochaetia bacterium]|nr:tripartite tricarboxylate transporter TctB family protein [Spirochaetia bacterium]
MKESNMSRADFVTSIFLIAFGIAALIMSAQMPSYAARGASPYSAPGLVPGFLGAIIAACGVVLFIRSTVKKGYKLGLNGRSVREFFSSVETRRLFITILLSVVYAIVLIGRITYSVATGIYILVFVLVFEYRFKEPIVKQWKTLAFAVALAVLGAAVVTAVFQYLFLVDLPG